MVSVVTCRSWPRDVAGPEKPSPTLRCGRFKETAKAACQVGALRRLPVSALATMECSLMTSRLRTRTHRARLALIARDALRQGRMRLVAGATVALTLLGGASLGFALNQDTPADPVGLQGIWPDFPPPSLSSDAFASLGGNWESWSQQAAIDVAELYSLAEKDLEAQRAALQTIQSRVRVLERALRDPAYSMIRDELTTVLVPLKLRGTFRGVAQRDHRQRTGCGRAGTRRSSKRSAFGAVGTRE